MNSSSSVPKVAKQTQNHDCSPFMFYIIILLLYYCYAAFFLMWLVREHQFCLTGPKDIRPEMLSCQPAFQKIQLINFGMFSLVSLVLFVFSFVDPPTLPPSKALVVVQKWWMVGSVPGVPWLCSSPWTMSSDSCFQFYGRDEVMLQSAVRVIPI